MSSRARSISAWTVGALFALPLMYVLSFGPACWWFAEDAMPAPLAPRYYLPLGWVARWSGVNGKIHRALSWYVTWNHQVIIMPLNDDEDEFVVFTLW